MIKNLWKFLESNFGKMPEWVQVSTYLLLVLLLIATYLNPKYIDIRLTSNIDGDEFPIQRAIIEIEVEDRILLMLSDNRGRFSVPVSFANPFTNYTFVLYPDTRNNRQKDVIISGKAAYTRWTKIIYNRDLDSYLFSYNKSSIINLFPSAFAQKKTEFKKVDNIGNQILTSISKAIRIPENSIPLESTIQYDLQMGNIEISYLIHILKENFNIDIGEAIWDKSNTVEDIIRLARANYYKDKAWGEHLISRINTTNELLEQAKKKYEPKLYNKFLAGRLLRKADLNERAVKYLSIVVKEDSTFYLAWFNLALAFDGLQNKISAEEAYVNGIIMNKKLNINDPAIYNTYGRFLYRHGRYKESLIQYQEVKKLQPDREYLDEYISDSKKKLEK